MGRTGKEILISGAGVAGPSLAYWLSKYGFQPTIVELAPGLRGGFTVDFRGETHRTMLERMGILEALRGLQTGGSPYSFVNEAGAEVARLPPEFAGGDLEIFRGDLCRVLYERSKDATEYLFGDSIASLTETPEGVEVSFEHGPARTFDLVVGADGLHSNVRKLAFGPESGFLRHLGYYFASWECLNRFQAGATRLMYNVPGKLASVGADLRDKTKAGVFCVFASKKLEYDRRDAEAQKRLVATAFDKVGWETPKLIATLRETPDLYFDSISRIDLASWSKGRVALLGDAGYGATLGGMGVGTAVVGAYVLAGELASQRGGYRAAFAGYESALRKYVKTCQSGGDRAGMFLAPQTAIGIRIRNAVLNSPWLSEKLLKQGESVASNIKLKQYAA